MVTTDHMAFPMTLTDFSRSFQLKDRQTPI